MDCKDLVSVEQEGLKVMPAIKLLQNLKKLATANHILSRQQKKKRGVKEWKEVYLHWIWLY